MSEERENSLWVPGCQEGEPRGTRRSPGCCWRCRWGCAEPQGSVRALLHKGQRCLGQHPVFPRVLLGREAKPGVLHLVQHPNLSPRGVGGCEQVDGTSPGASGSAGVPYPSHTSTSLLSRVDFCFPVRFGMRNTPWWHMGAIPVPAASLRCPLLHWGFGAAGAGFSSVLDAER